MGVIYLLTGIQHAARLVVSLRSLRQYYSGPVTVFTTRPESHQIGEYCRNDSELMVDHVQISEGVEHRNSSYVTKVTMLQNLPYEVSLFLDADTLVCGDIDELLYTAQHSEFVITSVANWTTADPHRQKLLKRWLELKEQLKEQFPIEDLVRHCCENALPSINTGVFSLRRNATVLQPWLDLTTAGRDMPIPDETALQLLIPRFEHVLFGTQFNCRPGAVTDDDIRIWHFLAGIHLKEQAAREIWLPAYEKCAARNTANIRAWSRVARKENEQEAA